MKTFFSCPSPESLATFSDATLSPKCHPNAGNWVETLFSGLGCKNRGYYFWQKPRDKGKKWKRRRRWGKELIRASNGEGRKGPPSFLQRASRVKTNFLKWTSNVELLSSCPNSQLLFSRCVPSQQKAYSFAIKSAYAYAQSIFIQGVPTKLSLGNIKSDVVGNVYLKF